MSVEREQRKVNAVDNAKIIPYKEAEYNPNYVYREGTLTLEDREHFLLNPPEVDAYIDRKLKKWRQKEAQRKAQKGR